MHQYDKTGTWCKITIFLSLKGKNNHSYIYSISFIPQVSPTTLENLKMVCLSGLIYLLTEEKSYFTVHEDQGPSGQLC